MKSFILFYFQFRSHVACEIIQLNKFENGVESAPISIIADYDDEVNIAQFHPDAGSGIVYGTKRGKVLGLQRYYKPY